MGIFSIRRQRRAPELHVRFLAMSESPQKERYLIVFDFGSFVYMFLIIGMSTGLVVAIIDGVWRLIEEPSLSGLGWVMISLLTAPFGFGLSLAMIAAIGFLPYRWLCKRGWGWPTKGVFVKVELAGDSET